MSELGHSLQVRPRPLVHKCLLCSGFGFVAMCHKRPSVHAFCTYQKREWVDFEVAQ